MEDPDSYDGGAVMDGIRLTALAIKNAVDAPLLAEVERHRKEAMCE